jgi:hypothetical protein
MSAHTDHIMARTTNMVIKVVDRRMAAIKPTLIKVVDRRPAVQPEPTLIKAVSLPTSNRPTSRFDRGSVVIRVREVERP